jgi:hypothetical protein
VSMSSVYRKLNVNMPNKETKERRNKAVLGQGVLLPVFATTSMLFLEKKWGRAYDQHSIKIIKGFTYASFVM